ncbi:R3H domain-containing protein 1-like protein [Tanacetum coccineum]
MKRKRIETSKTDLERSKIGGHLQELEQAAKSKNYALMWVVQMEREVANDNQIARKLLDVVKDVNKSLKKRRGIIDELKVKKGMRTWRVVTTFYREVKHQEMEMRQQLMLHINETHMRTFEKREFVETMKKL